LVNIKRGLIKKSIFLDITTGLIVSHYCFMLVEKARESFDNFFAYWYERTCGIWANAQEEKDAKMNLTKEASV